ncbi:unnamed protein product [Dovyalis caffra]|uniref:Phosphatidic acid phosphatase type 2/haloperoxidase domain-containing protein n=1 Tax=Dovyalis caffra TaxID=77055 RepID=A0AAV1SQD5_9ROSI|nr:unnamed protein product [Dovyalis caffra]
MSIAKPPSTFLQKILTLDTKFSHYLHSKFHTLLPLFFLLILEISADFRFSFPISLSILFTLSFPSLLPFISSLLLGLLLDLAAVGLIKILFRRPRPPYNHLSSMSTPVSADHFSFPSGHSSRVSFVAALVFLYKEVIEAAVVEVRDKGGVCGRWVGEEGKLVKVVVVGVCVWAVVTAVSRVLLGRHYFFDVFAGLCLGVIEGVFAFRVLRFEDIFWHMLLSLRCQDPLNSKVMKDIDLLAEFFSLVLLLCPTYLHVQYGHALVQEFILYWICDAGRGYEYLLAGLLLKCGKLAGFLLGK